MASYWIETEEGHPLELELAGLGSRAAAGALDLGLCFLVVMALSVVLGIISAVDPTFLSDFVLALLIGAGIAIPSLWQVFFAWRGRETPGKKSLALAVIDRTGAPAGLSQHALRGLFLPLELLPLPLPIGLMVIFAHPQGRRLGDMVAGTLVTRERQRPVGTWLARRTRRGVDPESVASYADSFTPARLARIGVRERALLLDFASRAGLRTAVRKDLASRLAQHFAELFELPEPESPAAFLAALEEAL